MYVEFYDGEENTETFGPFEEIQVVWNIEVRGLQPWGHTTLAENINGVWVDTNIHGAWSGFIVKDGVR